ncbi:MAG: hypothetical protein NUV56_00595 [Candidatus Uhrbacteria bacterium]|nr:hypothetical protein [Candidatus Uhrbacteria bacterium]
MKPEPAVYRPIILRSLVTAWAHKELWPFALLASLAGTGVVVNDVLKQARIMFAPTIESYEGLLGNSLAFVTSYIQNLLLVGDNYLIGTSFLIVLGLVAFGILVATAQQIVLVAMHRAVRRKKRLPWREVLRSMHHLHIFRVLGIDLIFRLAALIVLTGSGLLLRNLVLSNEFDVLIAIAFSALTLGIAFALNIIAMFALIGVAREGLTFFRAMHEGIERLLRHPVISFEISAILFAANLLLSIIFLLGLAILAAPSALLFAEAIGTGSLVTMIGVALVSVIAFVAWTACVAGFATTFTYATWTELIERLEKTSFTPRIHAYSKKLVRSRSK